MGDDYQLNKGDVQVMLHWLRTNLPDKATPENAVWLLAQHKLHIDLLETYHPEVIEDMLFQRDSS